MDPIHNEAHGVCCREKTVKRGSILSMLQKGLKLVSSSLFCVVPWKFSQHQMCKKKEKKASPVNTSRHPGALEAVKLTPSRDKFAALGTSLKLACFHSWSEFASVWQWSTAWEGAGGFGLRMDSQNLLPPSLLPLCFALRLWSSQYFC